MTQYIVFNRATGDRVRPNPMSLTKAQALVDYLNSTARVRQYDLRPVGIFDPEWGHDPNSVLIWTLVALIVAGLVWLILNS